ncbi:MAG TPA: glycosyltransferase, partial [Thiobacillaceae bacterium]|nr:glycosyltransferase [Thiobacillaceae bacterium]
MVGRIIRKFGSLYYKYPAAPQHAVPKGPFVDLRVALVADQFTTECLAAECRVRALTPENFRELISSWRPHMVLVESAFHGERGAWRYELARQPKWLRLSPPQAIFRLVDFAHERGVPTVFWNKDDDAFFDAFIHVARVFDFIFTTDADCVPRYRQQVPAHVPVHTLSMPYQPAFHSFTGFDFKSREACFTGSYYRRILNERKHFLDMMFHACTVADLHVNVFDRNHHRLSRHLEFRYPRLPALHVHGAVPHHQTAGIYKAHVASLNVNSVTASDTMCSRRLLEILACGGIAVTNPSRAVERHFRDYCHVVGNAEEAVEVLARLRAGPS